MSIQPLSRSCAAWCCGLLFGLALAPVADAQVWPSTPVTLADGRLTLGVEAAVSLAPEDTAYFNYAEDAYSTLRLARFDASAVLRVGAHVSVLGDLRLLGGIGEGQWLVRPYALFARIRPWTRRAVDIQVGLVPPVFGAFSRRAYGTDNPLIGLPLAYQYVTSLRADALPASADSLLAMRGRGWLVHYGIGNLAYGSGVPLIDGLRYPAGVEVHVGRRVVEASVAVTTGTLAVPDPANPAGGTQVSARGVWRPTTGLVLGASAARGAFLDRSLVDALPSGTPSSKGDQRALGFDAEYSRGHWILREETIWSSWRVPAVRAPFIDRPLTALALEVEARYRIAPGLYAAARADRLDFSEVSGSHGSLPWDAPVRRIEFGGGYSIWRNVVLKAAYQLNWRDFDTRKTERLASAQLLLWF
jgi:hypothetical protein